MSKYKKIHLLGKGDVRHVVHLLWWMTGVSAVLALYRWLSANPFCVECCSTTRSPSQHQCKGAEWQCKGAEWNPQLCKGMYGIGYPVPSLDNSDSPSIVEQSQQGIGCGCIPFIIPCVWLFGVSYALFLLPSLLQCCLEVFLQLSLSLGTLPNGALLVLFLSA